MQPEVAVGQVWGDPKRPQSWHKVVWTDGDTMTVGRFCNGSVYLRGCEGFRDQIKAEGWVCITALVAEERR